MIKAIDFFCQSCRLQNRLMKSKVEQVLTSRGIHRWHPLLMRKRTYYEILELPTNASKQEIKAAFVDLSMKHHPDKNPENPKTHEKFVRITKAYSTLIRPESRREYDTSLAYRLQQHKMARTMSNTHAYGSSTKPDNWTEDDYSERTYFYDESIFDMRDKSKDSYDRQQHRHYYGFKGVNRVSNTVIVWACVGLLVAGAIIHIIVIGASSRHTTQVLDERDKRLHASYMATKQRARTHGTDHQLSILSDRVAKRSGTMPVDSIKPN